MSILLLVLFFIAMPALAQEQQDVNNVISRMQAELDLQPDQVSQVTPVLEKYSLQFKALQQSIDDGTINPSVIDSQRQGIEDSETQDLSAYLKPYQLARWREMQKQMALEADDIESGSDQYSNLPRANSPAE
jgi:hypothetical protein